jgi:hypothetical protein
MADPVGSTASLIVLLVVFGFAVAIFYAGGLWPLLFFISATAVQSDHDLPTSE